MRIVIDTNVLVSGVFWAGRPFQVLELWAQDHIQVLASDAILREYADVLHLIGSAHGQPQLAEKWIAFFFQHTALIDVRDSVTVCRDPDDNKFLSCAIDGDADYIVSGDRDLLDLKEAAEIPIITPRQFLAICRS